MHRYWRYHLAKLWFPYLILFLLGYFLYYFFYGQFGYFALKRLKTELVTTQAQYESLKKQHDLLAHKVALLQPRSLDLDLLEERVRFMLNYGNTKDVIIFEEN
tara:strand:+ start:454 stop:762 length:309 start_codon:yes stop_codon:yes gene_type:complete